MSQANRNLVADALESGEFEQGHWSLCENGRHCCLGVACEIYQRHVGDLVITEDKLNKLYDSDGKLLPEKVRKWLGFSNSRGAFNDGENSLASLNDDDTPFTEIAKLFRNPPKGLLNESSES